MTAAPLLAPGPARRRAGTLLLAYGVTGILLLGGLFLVTLSVAFMGRDGFARLDAAIDVGVGVIESTSQALTQADATLVGVGTTLQETSTTLAEAGALTLVLRDGAGTLADQAAAFSLIGQTPFAGIADPLREAATGLDDLSGRMETTGATLDTNALDVAGMAVRLGAVAQQLDAANERLAGIDTQLGPAGMLGTAVILAIIGWLMAPALAAIWVGRRWRREVPA